MVTMASMPSLRELAMTWSEMSRTTSSPFSSVLYWKGLPRLVVPRIVPPRGRIPLTRSSVSSKDFSGQISPSKPSGMPTTFHFCSRIAALVAARMTALSPGASPPPVAIPMHRMSDMMISWESRRSCVARIVSRYDHTYEWPLTTTLPAGVERGETIWKHAQQTVNQKPLTLTVAGELVKPLAEAVIVMVPIAPWVAVAVTRPAETVAIVVLLDTHVATAVMSCPPLHEAVN